MDGRKYYNVKDGSKPLVENVPEKVHVVFYRTSTGCVYSSTTMSASEVEKVYSCTILKELDVEL
jgi:hypothetical protein